MEFVRFENLKWSFKINQNELIIEIDDKQINTEIIIRITSKLNVVESVISLSNGNFSKSFKNQIVNKKIFLIEFDKYTGWQEELEELEETIEDMQIETIISKNKEFAFSYYKDFIKEMEKELRKKLKEIDSYMMKFQIMPNIDRSTPGYKANIYKNK